MSGHGIFISYRREDSQGESGRLDDHLRRRYGDPLVFRDVHDSPPGVSFPDYLQHLVSTSRVAIVVIGQRWRQALLDRRDRGYDWVRLEIATALRSQGVTVLPVLVQGATMPAPEELPPDLRRLSTITALELSDGRWDYDVNRLIELLDRLLPPAAMPVPTSGPDGTGAGRATALTCGGISLIGIGVVIAIVIAAVLLVPRIHLPIGPGSGDAAIQLSPTSGGGGATVTVTGSGFQAGETVQIFFQGQLVSQPTADRQGGFTAPVTVPQGLASFHGEQVTVTASGKSSVRSADGIFTIQ